jgi:PAS domain S-box-containing protein
MWTSIRETEARSATRSPPDSVVVARAPAGEITFSNRYSERVVGRLLSELADDFPMFHLDGRPYALAERQILRSISTGEKIVDEEFFGGGLDSNRVRYRCSSWPLYDDRGEIASAVAVTRDVTEQRRQEERVAYLPGLLDNTEDGIVAMDEGYLLTAWNKGAERLYGWTAEEVIGRHANEVARTNLSEDERTAMRRELADVGRWRGEVIMIRKDATTIDVELISVALRGPDEAITGYLTIHRDISERKRAEEALRQSQRRSETILESITDGFLAVDRTWRLTYANERALRRMTWRTARHLTREDVVGQNLWALFPDVVGTALEERSRDAMRERREVRFEEYFAPTDEWIEAHLYPSETGLSIYYREVSDRKRAESELESTARQQGVVAELGLRALAADELQELLDEAVELVAQTLNVEFAGVAEIVRAGDDVVFRAGVGWRDGTVGQRLGPRGGESLTGYTLRRRAPVISEDMGADRRFNASSTVRDHGVVSALAVMIATPDEPFGTLGAYATSRRAFGQSDVSFVQAVANVLAGAVERERAQERLSDVREAERRRLARDLHDEALQQLTLALAEARRREPPAAGSGEDDRLVPALKSVGEHLRAAIYDLRLKAHEGRAFPELLEALVEVHDAMAAGSRVELDIEEGLPNAPLGSRGTEILRLVGEALTNARRHSGAATIRVTASGSEAHLCVEIADDGRGFDPGSQPRGAAAAGITGMRERAALLGGDLDIRSEPGAGATVRFELALGERGPRAGHRVRVLLVEDHTAVRQAIASMFEREPDFDVVGQAGSLAEARDMLQDIDVAVVDLGLPDGYGGDLIEDLSEVNPRAQALVLSAGLDRSATARAIQSGAAGTLDKTVQLDEIVDAVRRLRAGETLMPLDEVLDLLRFAGRQREQEEQDRTAIDRLTPREVEVLQALAEGLDSQAVANRLYISIRTERNHVASILAKLGVHSRLQALVFALRYGVVDVP